MKSSLGNLAAETIIFVFIHSIKKTIVFQLRARISNECCVISGIFSTATFPRPTLSLKESLTCTICMWACVVFILRAIWWFVVQSLSSIQLCNWPHGLQPTRLPCPSLSPRVCSNSCPLSWWCHPTIPSSVIPFSSCFQSFPASESFLMSQLFTPVGQSIGASASAISPSSEYSGLISFRIDWFDLLAVWGTLKSLLQHHSLKHQFSMLKSSLWSNSHIRTWLLEKP